MQSRSRTTCSRRFAGSLDRGDLITEQQQVSRANCLSANIAGSMLRRRAMAGKSVMLKKLGGFPADRIDRE